VSDAYLQVAPDSTGKTVDMDLVATAAGASIYRERVAIVGFTGEQFDEMLTTQRQVLACLRAILASINSPTSSVTEDDFAIPTTNYLTSS
jgi:hypothetical protein